MFVLFGVSRRNHVSSQHGQFFCPHCRVNMTYADVTQKKVFHFFFVPLITLDQQRGYQCLGCENFLDESALTARPQDEDPGWACPKCSRNWPSTNIRCPICRVTPTGEPR